MRKSAVLLLAILTVFAFVSCNKSGVYKPKEKISKIMFEQEKSTVIVQDSVAMPTINTNVASYLREAWEWDKKELKSRTIYKPSGEAKYNYKYEYKDGKIVGITTSLDKKTRIRFMYDDNSRKINEVKYFTEVFNDNKLPYRWLEISYDGNKVSSIKETINTERYNRFSAEPETFLACLVSEEMFESIENNAIMPKIQYNQQFNQYDFEWDGKNISKVTVTEKIGEDTKTYTIEYTYDKNRNPQLSRYTGLIESDAVDFLILSKHNVLSCKYESSTMTYTEDCEYTYDKKVPVTKTVTRKEFIKLASNMTSEVTSTEKWSYEYVED